VTRAWKSSSTVPGLFAKRDDGMTTPTETVPSENGMSHHQPSAVVTTTMSPPVGPSARRKPEKWANAAERSSSGSFRRPPSRRDMRASRPVASTTAFAFTSQGASPSTFTRTPTALSPSKRTSSTRAPSVTTTPASRACPRRSASNSARFTWKAEAGAPS
jgi:hypothetical protein